MKIRFNVNEHGHTHLQQLLQIMSPAGDKIIDEWENIPVTGPGLTASYSIPILNNTGVFIFEEDIQTWKPLSQEDPEIKKVTYVINSLSIVKVSESDTGKLLVHTLKNKFYINTDMISFIKLLTEALSKFMIIHIDSKYNIKEISYGEQVQSSTKEKIETINQNKRKENVRPRTPSRTTSETNSNSISTC